MSMNRAHWSAAKSARVLRLGEDVIGQADVQVALALEDDAVADDIVGGVGEPQEHRHDEAEEKVSGDMVGARQNRTRSRSRNSAAPRR